LKGWLAQNVPGRIFLCAGQEKEKIPASEEPGYSSGKTSYPIFVRIAAQQDLL